ncbi:MAG: hypothetical protein FWD01_04190, partial [Defluviitaleaceae bacterium]|nr:hypothetical protein [Defluviitaleaceae bacterium]
MFTNRMRFTGMSGIDTASMVEQIMRAQSVRLDRMRQDRDIMRWQQEMMRGATKNLQNFQRQFTMVGAKNDLLSRDNFRAFNAVAKAPGSGNPVNGVTVTASPNAAISGNFNVQVHSIAQGDLFRTTNNLNEGARAATSLDFSKFYDTGTSTWSGADFRVNLNGANLDISFTAAQMETFHNNISTTGRQDFVDAINSQLFTRFGRDTDQTGTGVGNQRIWAEIDIGSGNLVFNTNSTRSHRGTISNLGDSETLQNLGFGLTAGQNQIRTNLDLNNTSLKDFLGVALGTIDFEINGVRFREGPPATPPNSDVIIDGDMSLNQLINAVNSSDAGVRLTFNDLTGKFSMEGTRIGAGNEIAFSDTAGGLFAKIFGGNSNTAASAAHVNQASDAR